MKKTNSFIILIAFILPLFAAQAQGQDKDLAFVRDAASGGLFEVQIGKLAATKSQSKEVKAFAQKMVTDHSKANAELKKLAASKKITLPDSMDVTKKSIYDSIAVKKGEAFDKEYIKHMVKAHDQDVSKFESASKSLSDADLKGWVAKTLPVLKMHQKHIHSMSSKEDTHSHNK